MENVKYKYLGRFSYEIRWYAIPSHRLRRLLSPGRAVGSTKSCEKIQTLVRTKVIVSSFTKNTTSCSPWGEQLAKPA